MGFYYWRTSFEPSYAEKKLLDETHAQRLYVRFFDLDTRWYSNDNYTLEPVGRLQSKQQFPANIEVVPVVYITNYALEQLETKAEREKYVSLMVAKINRMAGRNGKKNIHEFQLDCDWTQTNRDVYFAFVKEFKAAVDPAKVSVTLRLHQYKYRKKSGIPPADRVMLMYYNMGELAEYSPQNYVLNNTTGKQYLGANEKYPLPMDFALPLYDQARKYNEDGNFIEFIDHYRMQELQDKSWMKKTGKYTWEVRPAKEQVPKLTSDWDYPSAKENMYEGTKVVYDKFSRKDLFEAAQLLQECVNTENYNVVFYHLDQTYTQQYKAYELEGIKATVN